MSKLSRIAWATMLALVFAVPFLLAQTPSPAPVPAIPPPNWSELAIACINALAAPLTVVFVWLAKLGYSKIPKGVVPWVAIALGPAAQWVVSLLTGVHADPIIGAACGAAAVWLREAINNVLTNGAQPAGSGF